MKDTRMHRVARLIVVRRITCKDGSKKLQRPARIGPTTTLARHLKTQHPINETKIKFALKIAKEYASNCELSRSIPKTDAPKKIRLPIQSW